MQTFRFTGSYSINTHNSLKHKAISRFYLQLILYASFCAPYYYHCMGYLDVFFWLSNSQYFYILFIRKLDVSYILYCHNRFLCYSCKMGKV